MKVKKFLIILILMIAGILFFNNKSYAADLDEIKNYVVTVEPRMNDGSLDITYEITWKVLDSTTEGPLQWVKIGTANSKFDTLQAMTSNIKSISQYSDSYVKIVFDRSYYAGEEITFKYSLHQSYMYTLSWGNCKYSFTPAWFTDAKIDCMTIRWNSDGVKSSNKKSKDGAYYVWSKTNMSKGEKMTAKVTYKKEAFTNLNKYKQSRNVKSSSGSSVIIYIIFIVVAVLLSMFGRGNYYTHGGFGGGYYYGGGCAHSSCACACANSCACACAGSGRAGCSKKDFYGTKLKYDVLKKKLEE